MSTIDKTVLEPFGLALRYPYITNPLLAFLLRHGLTIQHISRAAKINRRTLLKHQLGHPMNKKHTRRLAQCVNHIIAHARQAKKLTDRTKQTDLYHDQLDTTIAWGEYIIKQQRSKFNA